MNPTLDDEMVGPNMPLLTELGISCGYGGYKYSAPLELGNPPADGITTGGKGGWKVKLSPAEFRYVQWPVIGVEIRAARQHRPNGQAQKTTKTAENNMK